MTVGWDWNKIFSQRNSLRLAEQGNQHKHSQRGALQKDGNDECTAANAAFAAALFRIAFDQTTA
jgi:hypothetical protein